jgi:Fur family ferric uptake transcriptional regulator
MTSAQDSQQSQDELEELRDRLEAYMNKEGLRSTAQRRLVTDTFFQSEGHLSIEELLSQVRQRDPKVGYATVYRTLKLLRDSGLANERNFGDNISRYEVAHEDAHHDHLICTECGNIQEFEDEAIERLQDTIAERYGYKLTRHKHDLFGLCPNCQKK